MLNPLWLCLRFPQLALDGVLRGNEARAGLAPELEASEREKHREEKALRFLADWAYQFTPAVSPHPPDTLLLEIAGCLRLFGGLQKLRHAIDSGLQQLGFTCASAVAHTPKAAIAFSHSAPPQPLADTFPPSAQTFLQSLQHTPLAHLALNPKQLRQLHQLGLSRAGELLALPKADLGKRFGKGLVTYLEKLSGESPDPQAYITPSPCFESEMHFPHGLSTVAMLAPVMRRLLQELHQYLSRRQLYCSGFCWHLLLFDKQARHLRIELSHAQGQLETFYSLTQLQLEKLVLTAAVETLLLRTDQLEPAAPDNQPLFRELSGPGDSDQWILLDKLRGRLGAEALFCLQLQDEHLPELRQRKAALPPHGQEKSVRNRKRQSKQKPDNGQRTDAVPPPPPQPLWLFDPPQPLKQRQGKLYFQGVLTLVSGPQRFDSHWWQQRQARDYFIARHQNGVHYSIYRDCLHRHWYLHGVFS